MEVRLEAEAVAELDEGIAWYSSVSLRAPERFEAAVWDGIDAITRNPYTWPETQYGGRRYRLDHFPYVIVYVVERDVIRIFAIGNLHRKPGYWRSRLRH